MIVLICVVQDVSLSQSNLPNEGLVDVITKYRNFTICNNGLLRKGKTLVCKHFGYPTAASLHSSRSLSSSMHGSFTPGNVKCDAQVNDISQCAITQKNGCSQYSYVTCKHTHSFFLTSGDILGHTYDVKESVGLKNFQ